MKRRRRVTRARLCKLLDYDRESGEFRWREQIGPRAPIDGLAGTRRRDGYRRISINGRHYMVHQLAWLYVTGKWCSAVIDHRDGDPSNNRWDNLRRATKSQSSANRRFRGINKCGFKGVSRRRRGWRATIQKNGRVHHLGLFPTPEEAHAAYAEAAHKLFGEFARPE